MRCVCTTLIIFSPQQYLKEFLNEMCVYNTKPPHKFMWELKPEYRHYENPEKGEDEEMT